MKLNKGKVKVHTLDIAPLRSESHRRSTQVWRVISRDFTVISAHSHVHPQWDEPYLPLAPQAAAGTHLPTPEGWKAE